MSGSYLAKIPLIVAKTTMTLSFDDNRLLALNIIAVEVLDVTITYNCWFWRF